MKNIALFTHEVAGEGLKTLFSRHGNLNVVQSHYRNDYRKENLASIGADAAVIDADFYLSNSLRLIEDLRYYQPDIKIILFGFSDLEPIKRHFRERGADLYISKNEAAENMLELTERLVVNGETFPFARRRKKRLSDRQFEVLGMILAGKKNREIADKLEVNEKTISTYRTRLYEKFEVNTEAELVAFLYQYRLLREDGF